MKNIYGYIDSEDGFFGTVDDAGNLIGIPVFLRSARYSSPKSSENAFRKVNAYLAGRGLEAGIFRYWDGDSFVVAVVGEPPSKQVRRSVTSLLQKEGVMFYLEPEYIERLVLRHVNNIKGKSWR
jgi:hypothetical protein